MRVSSGSRCYRSVHFSNPEPLLLHLKPPINPSWVGCTVSSFKSCQSFHVNFQMIDLMKLSIRFHYCFPVIGGLPKPLCNSSKFSVGNSMKCWSLGKSQRFLSSHPLKGEGVRPENTLPWLAANNVAENNVRKAKWSEKLTLKKGDMSSWKGTNTRLDKMRSSRDNSEKRFGKRSNRLAGDDSAKKYGETPTKSSSRSTWEVAAENFVKQGNESANERIRGRSIGVDNEDHRTDHNGTIEAHEEQVEEEIEANDDPRWDKIKGRFKGMMDGKVASGRPEVQRWSKQESWGRKTWREASESTIPKMVGEGVYGVGPVLAALSAGRREFYALFMQEGLDLSSNNRKKKDKKGFEKVLKLAEKNALTIKEISKHDLNMLSDNRPHQGLVLDASPLEMVRINELDPVSPEEDKGSLWLALDEVMDPQNLGAIIRSAYFFGASGVVLCAKNSAPLSGVVSKASAGSLELMELRYCKNMMQFLASSAENGWRVLGASVSSKAVALNKVLAGAPTILVLGSEGTGLRPLVERSCTQLVRIPGNTLSSVSVDKEDDTETTESRNGGSLDEFRSFLAVESLNVSVAAGVFVHHLIGRNYQTDSQLGGNDESLEISPLP